MKTKLFVSLMVIAMLLAVVGVAAAAPANQPGSGPIERRIDTILGDVTAINGAMLSVHSIARGDVQVLTNDRTRFHSKDKPNLTPADIKVGDRIAVRGQWQDGKLVARDILLIPASLRDKVGGKVASLTGTTIVVTKIDGSIINIATDVDTKFHTPGNPNAALADVKVGDVLEAVGQLSGNTLLAAQVVFRTPPERTPGPIAPGKIDAINGGVITLKQAFGVMLTVNTSANTIVIKRSGSGPQVITLAELRVGDSVMVIGPRSSDGHSIEARAIVVGQDQPAPQPNAEQHDQPPLRPSA
jgi:hypothetical protein